MADIINELVSKCGISPDMAKKGLGTLLAAFKHVLPADSYAKIEGAIPGAPSMLADAQAEGEASSGGLLGRPARHHQGSGWQALRRRR
jgi:hypothetical protein